MEDVLIINMIEITSGLLDLNPIPNRLYPDELLYLSYCNEDMTGWRSSSFY